MEWTPMRVAHLFVVTFICIVPFLPKQVILRYKLYLLYLGLVTMWLALGKCPMTRTHDTPVEIIEYRPSFVHKLIRILFPKVDFYSYQNIFLFVLIALLTITTVRIRGNM